MKRRMSSLLNEQEKKKARILINSIPQAFLYKHGIRDEPKTVKDMIAVCEIVHVYISDMDSKKAESIYKRLEFVMGKSC